MLIRLHVALAIISVTGFAFRWGWRSAGNPAPALRSVRALPHVVDTLFLASGIALALHRGFLPTAPPWLIAKLAGLVVYIVLGAVAMRCVVRRNRSLPAFIAALLAYAWIVSVALTKSALGMFMVFG